MKKLSIILVMFAFIAISGCGEKMKEIKQASQVIQKVPGATNKAEDLNKIAEARIAERRKTGDTLAMHFTKLQEFLPKTVAGYVMEEPKGSTTNMGGFSFSTAEYDFNKDNGEHFVHITLVDYNASYAIWSGFAALSNLGLGREDQNGWDKSVNTNIDNVFAREEWDKNSKTAKATYAIGYRFLLTIEANNQENTDFVKSITGSINMNAMAKM